jgi:hypothetical protein
VAKKIEAKLRGIKPKEIKVCDVPLTPYYICRLVKAIFNASLHNTNTLITDYSLNLK